MVAPVISGEEGRLEQEMLLAEALAKIRHHTSSKLPNQRAPAQLLVAVEATLTESENGVSSSSSKNGRSSTRPTPTAYFMALLAMVDKATTEAAAKSGNSSEGSLLTSCLYLLNIITPHVSHGVLRAKVDALLEPLVLVLSSTTTGKQLPDMAESQAALLRSALGIFEPLLLALHTDRATLSSHLTLRGCWNSTLRLCLDARPKVRRRAQELVSHILVSTDDVSPSTKAHPFAAKTAEWAISALAESADAASVTTVRKQQQHQQQHQKLQSEKNSMPTYDVKKGRAKQPEIAAAARQREIDAGSANSGIWICGFLKQLAPSLPNKAFPQLVANLLRILSQKNPFLSSAAFEVFETLFKLRRPDDTTGLTTSSLDLSGNASKVASARVKLDGKHDETLLTTFDALSSPSVLPGSADVQLAGPYLRALENAMVALSRVENGQAAWKRFSATWDRIVALAFSSQSKASRDSTAVRVAGKDALCAMVRYCIPDSAIEEGLKSKLEGTSKSALLKILAFLEAALDKQSLKYSPAWPELFAVLTSLVLRLQYRPGGEGVTRTPPAATTLVLHLVAAVGNIRSRPKFEHREHADAVLSAAVQVCGPAAVMRVLPLGLLGENGPQGGRAWLLPLMRSAITNTELTHFTTVMVPLSETLFNKQAEAEEPTAEGKPKAPMQAKVYEALTEQIWSLLPGYCDLPTDLTGALSNEFVGLLTNVLYSQPSLRPSICRALQILVERSQSLAKSMAPDEVLHASFGLNANDGKTYLSHLSDVATNLLAVFLNIFSQSPGESRGFVAECMTAFLGIMSAAEISPIFTKVVDTLESTLPHLQPSKDRESGPKSLPPIPHTMMDLLVLLVPFLSPTETKTLFQSACQDELLAHRDAGIQKKTYRLMVRLLEGQRGIQILAVGTNQAGELPILLQKLQDTSGKVIPGAKRDRTALLASLVPLIPSTELHFLPSIIPEAVLATKEVNQNTRELAYRLLVEMGRKVESGGTIKRGLVTNPQDSTDDDEEMAQADVVEASVNEYITMVAAGLAGTSPHMISATITALARLVYEFHTVLPMETISELVATMEVFLESPNREVAKSALGFVKVATVSLPAESIDESLAGIVAALFSSKNHHRVHFKAKIRHIFERLLRRFGYDRIYELTDDDNRKLLTNIRKRKERAKRKRNAASDENAMIDEDEEEGNEAHGLGPGQRAVKAIGADAFEEAIYGSESDLSDDSSDNEDLGGKAVAKKKSEKFNKDSERKKGGRDAEQDYLLQDDDTPLDLLDRSAMAGGGRITNRNGGPEPTVSRKRRPGQDASRFKLDEETGRMVVEESDDDSEKGPNDDAVDVDGAGRAYLDRERGTHGFTSKDGVVRLNKNNKRNRAEDDEMDQEQIALEEQLASTILAHKREQEQQSTAQRNAKKPPQRQTIGNEFRATKAGGDIKRGQVSPFAYVPLSQVGGKRKQKGGGHDHEKTRGGKGGSVRFLARDKKRRT